VGDSASPFVAAIIPARGGSKRVERKNLRPFAGVPLLVHTIRAAQGASHVREVFVSTEDAEIARVAVEFGATVIERPRELATDTAGTEPVLFHAVDWLTAQGRTPDVVVLLQATSPLRPAKPIDEAIEKVLAGADSCVSVTRNDEHFWLGRLEGDRFTPNRAVGHRPRTQEIAPMYHENGAIYAVRTTYLQREKLRMGGDLRAVVLEPHEAIDIDTPEQFEFAEFYASRPR
jgi:CMP-N,N'-diacetyllegionaminic acid synthase